MFVKKMSITVEKMENGFYISLSQSEHGYGPNALLLPKVEFIENSEILALTRVEELLSQLKSVQELNGEGGMQELLGKMKERGQDTAQLSAPKA